MYDVAIPIGDTGWIGQFGKPSYRLLKVTQNKRELIKIWFIHCRCDPCSIFINTAAEKTPHFYRPESRLKYCGNLA